MTPFGNSDYSIEKSSMFDFTAFVSDNANRQDFDVPIGHSKKYEASSAQLPNLFSLQSSSILNDCSTSITDVFEINKLDKNIDLPSQGPQQLKKNLKSCLESTLNDIDIMLESTTTPRKCSLSTNEPLSTANDGARNYLHRACQLFSNSADIIRSALLNDHTAVRRYEKLEQIKSQFSGSGRKRGLRQRKVPFTKHRVGREPYQLPVNIALKHKASHQVVELLVDAGPEVLELQDGCDGSNSLGIALKTKPNDIAIIDILLVANPKCAMRADRRQNYPLHIACAKGSNLDIVRHLYLMNPDALWKKNFNGETPLDIAQRYTTMCRDDVIDFLQECVSDRITEA